MADTVTRTRGQDIRVIGLIGVAHSVSHFYQLVLPPLFPILKEAFGVGYAELGLLATFFYAASGLSQTAAGFAVDRFGARTVLLAGIALFATAILLIGLAPSYWLMVPLVVAAGMGNSVFHPADYSVLTSAVRKEWMARAYGIHQLGGNLGWAVAPAAVLTLTHFFGWRSALVILGLFGYVLLLVVWWQGTVLLVGDAKSARSRVAAGPRTAPLQLLMAPAILLCFAYFAMLAMALTGFQSFLPAALETAHGTSLVTAGWALTGYLVGGAAGILFGGWLADRSQRHERILAVGLLAAAVLVMIVGIVDLAVGPLVVMISAAGFCSGMTSPSRDMMVRGATPPGSTGKVFGFVYSGLDLGSALVPPVLGLFLDHGAPIGVFSVTALALALCIIIAYALQRAGNEAAALAVRPAE
jgi:FSR family fosmidomycin resistance protein-like MFS transporter